METSENIKSYYQDYISIYKDETDRLKQFKTFIDKTESDQLFDRKNFVGHITGSAIIFDYKNSKVLLIKHIILQRWLQPGGHIEKTDASILDGVYREIFEETNIAKDDLMLISPIFGKKIPHRHRLASHPRESGQTRKTTLSSRPPLFFYLQRRKDHGRKRKLKVE